MQYLPTLMQDLPVSLRHRAACCSGSGRCRALRPATAKRRHILSPTATSADSSPAGRIMIQSVTSCKARCL